jgi:hypothetical protein
MNEWTGVKIVLAGVNEVLLSLDNKTGGTLGVRTNL